MTKNDKKTETLCISSAKEFNTNYVRADIALGMI